MGRVRFALSKRSVTAAVTCLVVGFLLQTASAQTPTLAFTQQQLPFSAGGSASAVADFDGDGIPDVAYANSNQIIILYSRSGYNSASQQQITVGAGLVNAIATADVNQDGYPDLIVGGGPSSTGTSGTVKVFYGNSGGVSGTASITLSTPSGGSGYWNPDWIGVADFDGNGSLDIAATTGSGLIIWMNFGSSGFGTRSYTSVTSNILNPAGVAVATIADFNRDGLPDLAVAYNGTSVAIVLGQLNGTPAQVANVSLSGVTGTLDTASVVSGDFNGDGVPDLAIMGGPTGSPRTYTEVFIARGNGDGTFTLMNPGSPIQPGLTNITQIGAVDLDGDGYADLIVAGNSAGAPKIEMLPSNGNFTFGSATGPSSTGSSGGYGPVAIPIADFNGDGFPDILMGGGAEFLNASQALAARRNLTVYSGVGQSTPAGITVPIATPSTTAASITATNATASPWLTVTSPTRTATAGSPAPASISANQDSPNALTAGTYQGKVSYTASGFGGTSTNVTLKVANPSGTLNFPGQVFTLPGQQGTQQPVIAAGDFNGDGVADLVTWYYNNSPSQGLVVETGNGSGVFSPSSTPANLGNFNYQNGLCPVAVTTGDFNGDGKLDAALFSICGGQNAAYITIALGDGAGGLTPLQPMAVPGLVNSQSQTGYTGDNIVVGDINNDGKLDIVVSAGGSIAALLNNGSGRFTEVWSSAGSASLPVVALALGDVNGDGKLDLVFNTQVSFLIVDPGTGTGTFATAASSQLTENLTNDPSEDGAQNLAIGDFNGDGIDDLAWVNWDGTGVFLALGGRTFGTTPPQKIVLQFNEPTKPIIAAVDLNGDGHLDLALAAVSGYTAQTNGIPYQAILGDGAGHLALSELVFLQNTPVVPGLLFVGDFNNDGIADVLAVETNNGSGAFSSQLVFGGLAPTTSVLSSAGSSITYGQPAPVSLAVTAPNGFNTPAGTAVLAETISGNTNTLGIQTVTGVGPWTFPGSLPGAGSHTVFGTYQGDTRNQASLNSNTVTFTVNKATNTSLSLSSSENPAGFADTVTLTAVLSPAEAHAAVTFLDGSNSLGTAFTDSTGTASIAVTTFNVATHNLTATFAGDANMTGATSSVVSLVVNPSAAGGGVLTITWSNLNNVVYDGNPHPAGAQAAGGIVPTLVYQALAGGAPTTAPPVNAGKYVVTATYPNYTSATANMQIDQRPLTIQIRGVNVLVDGSQHAVTVITSPAGVNNSVTYTGSAPGATPSSTAPSAADTYTVNVTGTDPNYVGSATGTLILYVKNTTTLTVSGTSSLPYGPSANYTAAIAYTGTFNSYATSGGVTFKDGTTTLGTLPLTYTGGVLGATLRLGFSVGNHSITATYGGDGNNLGTTSSAFPVTVTKATLAVTASAPTSFTYDKTAKAVTFTTTSSTATLATPVYSDSHGTTLAGPPTAAGSYTVVDSISATDPNYQGTSAVVPITIAKGTGTVTLGSLSQTFDNTTKSVTAITNPAGLAVNITYQQNGGSATPVSAGSYTVTATVADANYTSAPVIGTLVITSASAQITFSNLNQNYTGGGIGVTVATVPANLAVKVTYKDNTGTLLTQLPRVGGTYTAIADITQPGYAGHSEATLIINTPVTIQFDASGLVGPTEAVVSIDNNNVTIGAATLLPPGNYTLHVQPLAFTQSKYAFGGWNYIRCLNVNCPWSANGDYPIQVGNGANGLPQTQTYTLNMDEYDFIFTSVGPSGAGTVSGGGWWKRGSPYLLTATAASGYALQQWHVTDGLSGQSSFPTSSAISFVTTGGSSANAGFAPGWQVSLTASPSAGGSFTYDAFDINNIEQQGPLSSGGTINVGRNLNHFTATAVPTTGYTFAGWTGTGWTSPQSTGVPPATFTPTATFFPNADTVSLVANFVPSAPLLSASAGNASAPYGTVSQQMGVSNSGLGLTNLKLTSITITALHNSAEPAICLLAQASPLAVAALGAGGGVAGEAAVGYAYVSSGAYSTVSSAGCPSAPTINDQLPINLGNLANGANTSWTMNYSNFPGSAGLGVVGLTLSVMWTADNGYSGTFTVNTVNTGPPQQSLLP